MYGWEGRSFEDVSRLCARRDPRRFPLGSTTAGVVADDQRSEVLQWFRDHAEMSAFLLRMEPQRWGIRLLDLTRFKSAAEGVIVQLDVLGPTEALRAALSERTRPAFEVLWWGSFEELVAGRDGWPARVRHRYQQESPQRLGATDDLECFIDYLRRRYVPAS